MQGPLFRDIFLAFIPALLAAPMPNAATLWACAELLPAAPGAEGTEPSHKP